jgi:hypothetical protein
MTKILPAVGPLWLVLAACSSPAGHRHDADDDDAAVADAGGAGSGGSGGHGTGGVSDAGARPTDAAVIPERSFQSVGTEGIYSPELGAMPPAYDEFRLTGTALVRRTLRWDASLMSWAEIPAVPGLGYLGEVRYLVVKGGQPRLVTIPMRGDQLVEFMGLSSSGNLVLGRDLPELSLGVGAITDLGGQLVSQAIELGSLQGKVDPALKFPTGSYQFKTSLHPEEDIYLFKLGIRLCAPPGKMTTLPLPPCTDSTPFQIEDKAPNTEVQLDYATLAELRASTVAGKQHLRLTEGRAYYGYAFLPVGNNVQVYYYDYFPEGLPENDPRLNPRALNGLATWTEKPLADGSKLMEIENVAAEVGLRPNQGNLLTTIEYKGRVYFGDHYRAGASYDGLSRNTFDTFITHATMRFILDHLKP